MASWPTERHVMGGNTPRLEGPDKVSGRARYTSDINLPGMLYAVALPCPHGRAQVVSLDTSNAARMPGVKAVAPLTGPGRELRLHGDLMVVIAAETEAQARDAVAAVEYKLEELPCVVTPEAAMAADAPQLHGQGNIRVDDPQVRGNVDQALQTAKAVYEGTFECAIATHCCLEPHGAVAAWDGDRVTVWISTQAVGRCGEGIARGLQISPAKVEVICEHMGGGFGGKLGLDREAVIAAQMAKQAGRPVKFMMTREIEQTSMGSRSSARATFKLAADANGKLTAFDGSGYGTGGIGQRAHFRLPFSYNVPNVRYQMTHVYTNQGSARAMRAPGCPESSFLMESAMDGLAEQLGLDPVEFRLRNVSGAYLEQLRLGAERIGWSQRQPTGSQTGRHRTGYGCAITGWGGRGHDSNARVTIHGDGQVEIWCGTQDIGTGTRTALAIVAAETFGLQPEMIGVHVGHSTYPASGGSGGSTTIGGVSGAARAACEQALGQLRQRVGQTPRQLSWADACARLQGQSISVEAPRDPSLTESGVQGAQFAAVEVDTETGITQVTKLVAVQNCGSLVNRLTAESQIYGAIVMGLGFALFEEKVMDPRSGRMLNPDFEFYKVAGPSDLPEIEVLLQDQPERGVIGLGEPPTIPTAAAIANAVSNALGARVHALPLTPDKVLAALAGGREA